MDVVALQASKVDAAKRYARRSFPGVLVPRAPLPRVVASSAPTLSDSASAPSGLVLAYATPQSGLYQSAAAGTWAASTSYSVGNVVYVNSTYGYQVCGTAHTSSSAFATDVASGKWGPVGQFASFIGGGRFRTNASAWTASHIYPGDTTFTRCPYSIQFGFDGLKCVLRYTSAPGNYYRVRVDGEYVGSTSPTAGSGGGSTRYLTIDFTALGAAPRVIRIDMAFGDCQGVYVGATDSIWAVPAKGPRVIVGGDSYTGGSGSPSTGYTGISSWLSAFSDHLGWEDVWNSAIGGSGWLTRNGSVGGGINALSDRYAADFVTLAPDVLLFAAGHNDNPTYTSTQVGTAVTTTIAACRAGLPRCLIGVLGPTFTSSAVPPNPAPSATWTPYQDAISTAALAAGADFVVDTTRAQIFTGTGRAGTTTGAGNGDVYIQSDAVHPNQAGADYLGYRHAQLVLAALTRL